VILRSAVLQCRTRRESLVLALKANTVLRAKGGAVLQCRTRREKERESEERFIRNYP